MSEFKEYQKGFSRFLEGGKYFFSGFGESMFQSLKKLIQEFPILWEKSKTWEEKVGSILAGFLILFLFGYSIWGIGNNIVDWWNKDQKIKWEEKVLFQNYEGEIKGFFEKYNERFLAHDCDFMAKVGADEAMFDKWGHTTYGKNYSCEEFLKYQKKIIIPLKIEPIERNGEKYHVKGEAIIIGINQGEPWKIYALYFDLWKQFDWELWHFNNPKTGPRKIPLEMGD